MPYTDVPLAPGVNTEEHPVLAKPRWQSTNLCRFWRGWPQPIGGRQKIGEYEGSGRGIFSWAANDGRTFCIFGTTTKLYVYYRSFVYNITPIRKTTASIGATDAATTNGSPLLTITDAAHGAIDGDTIYIKGNQSIGGIQWGGGAGSLTSPFTTTAGSAFVSVAHVAHGMSSGDIATFAGASVVGGITPSGDYTVNVINANTYEIEVSSNAGVAATGGGNPTYSYHRSWIVNVTGVNTYTVTGPSNATAATGGSFTVEYEMNVGYESGSESATGATGGHGAGYYGSGTYGALISHQAQNYPRLWTFGAWGQNVDACPWQGDPVEWALNTSTRAAAIAGVPSGGVGSIFVTPYRQLMLCGSSDGVTYVPTRINYSDQEDNTVYTPGTTVLAGVFTLSQGSLAVRGAVTDRGMMIWTDKTVYPISYAGDPNAPYSLGDPLGTAVGLMGPLAMASKNGVVMWAGNNGNFYRFDGGSPQIVKCDVRGDVLLNRAAMQDFKAWMGTNKQWDEFWFGWQSNGSSTGEIDRYVIYAESEGWAPGSRDWTMWLDRQELSEVISGDADGNLYAEDVGTSDNGDPMIAEATTYTFDFGAGHPTMDLKGYIPVWSTLQVGVELTVFTQEYPEQTPDEDGPYTITPGQTEQSLRSSGNLAYCRFRSVSDVNCFWRPNGFWLDLASSGDR